MRSRYIYDGKGNLTYAEERGKVLLNQMPETKDAGYYVMPDIQAYRSMVDGSIISSRSRHREHLRQHGCVEIGNDSSLYRKPQPLQSPPGLKETVIQAANEKLRPRK